MAKMSNQHLSTVAFLLLLILNPAACVILRHVMNPIKWIRENLIRKPLDKGAVVRAFVDPFPVQRALTDAQFLKAADKYIPGPTVESFTKQQLQTSFLTDKQSVQKANLASLLSERFPVKVAFDQQHLEDYNAAAGPQFQKPDVVPERNNGNAIDLDKVFAPNLVTELKAASLGNLLQPVIKESRENRGEDGLGESDARLDQMLLERFGHLKEGQHVYDGSNLILNLPAATAAVKSTTTTTTTDSKKAEPKVAYIDLSDLKPLLTNRVLTVFTGLGSYTVPLGYEEMIPTGTNYIPEIAEDTEAKSAFSDTFGGKLKAATNKDDVYLAPKKMTLYPRPVETVETEAALASNNQISDDILNRFEKMAAMSVNRSSKTSHDVSPGVEELAASEKVDEISAQDFSSLKFAISQPQSPVYTATTAPQAIHPYDDELPQPVYGQPELHDAEVAATPATDDDVKHHIFQEQVLGLQSVQNTTIQNATLNKTEAEIEKLQNAIVSRIHGGMEGYFQHVKDNHDDENCISLMICEMSANPTSYGVFGNNTARYFRETTFPTEDLASNYYKRVTLMAEEHGDLQRCHSSFKECLLSSLQLAELGRGLMFDIVLD